MKSKLVYLFLKEYYSARRINRFTSVEQIKEYQEKKLHKHLSNIVKQSVFYEKRFAQLDLSRWRELPVMDKKIMMDSFDELNTVGIKKEEAFNVALKSEETRDFSSTLGDITVGLSSGTSGNRGLFIISKEEQFRWAGNILGKTLPESLFFGKKQKIAFFLRADSNLYNSVKNPKIEFQFFDLLDEIDTHIKRLNNYQPTLLIAPASMLKVLSQAQMNGKLKTKPTKIVSVAEALNEEDKQEIEKTFNQVVHQVYQCTEGFLAHTCAKGTLHINEDLIIIEKEYIDKENGKFVPIITDFSRTSQPIIRYRLNDVLTEGTPCDCGSHFTTLKQIDGRCDDMFYGIRKPSGELKILFADFIRRAVISATDVSLEYKVKQMSLNEIIVELLLTDEQERKTIEAEIKKNLEHFFNEMDCSIPNISFGQYIPSTKGTKIRLVERHFQVDGGIS